MVCKKEVINWFRDLSACRRIEFLCALMDCCGPLELRFLGTYIEDLGRRDYDRLREMELNANDVNYLSKLINISDIRILDKVLTSLALMYSTCKEGARVLFKTLKEHTDTILNGACPREPGSETREKVVLLAVMAVNHPAFTFSEKQALRSQLSALLQADESTTLVPSEDCTDEVNGVKDITSVSKEPQSQVLSDVTVSQTHVEQDPSDAGEGKEPVTSHNETTTVLENNKNSSHQDQENPVFICNIEGKGLKKRPSDNRYEYSFMVHWSDGTVTNVSKTHAHLLDFQCKLNKLFPEEAGEQHQDRVIPYLPGKRIFSTAQKGELAEKMLPEIAEYAKNLSALPQHILRCELFYSFFQSSETTEAAGPDSAKVGSQANPPAQEQDLKLSPSPTQTYQQLPQHVQHPHHHHQQQQQQQQYVLQPDIEQQQLQLHYHQQMMTNPLQQQYHGQMFRQSQQQQQMHQPRPPYSQASATPQMVPQQPLTQHQQSLHPQQIPSMQLQQQQQQAELSVHHGQLQPGQQQGMQSSQNQSHPVSTSQSQQLPPHSVHPHYQEFYTQQDVVASSKQNQVQGTHQQFGKYSKQLQQQQQTTRQPSHQQQPQMAESMPSRRSQSDPTPPPSQPVSHQNLTALVSQMHISQHHQVNLSTPNIPPAVVSNSNSSSSSSSMGVCKHGTAVTSSVVTTIASSGSVYYQTVTSTVSIQSPPSDPYTTTPNNTGPASQQIKASTMKDQSKHASNINTNPPVGNMAPPYPATVGQYQQFPKENNVDPLIHEWLKKQRLHKYTKFFEGKSVEQVLQLSDKEVDSWGIVLGAKGRIKSQLEQLRQKGLSGLNGMSQMMSHTPPPPLYYQGQLYPPLSGAMLSQFRMPPGVGGEGTGSEASSSPSSPRESSDENERESEESEGSVLSSPDTRSITGVNREPGSQQQQQQQQRTTPDNNGTQATTLSAQPVNPQFLPQMNSLSGPHANPIQSSSQPNAQPGSLQGSLPNQPVNMSYNYSAMGPSPNMELLPTGPVDLRRLIDGNHRQPDSRLAQVGMIEMTGSTIKGGNGSHGGNGGSGGSGMSLPRQQSQVPMVAHVGDPSMMGVPPPNIPPPLPSLNQMDVGANIPPQVVNIKQQQQQQQPQQQQQSVPGIQYSVECADSNIFKMPSIVVPDVVPTSTASPGLSIPSSLPLTPRNEGPSPSVSGSSSPRLLPSPINPNFPGTRASFAPQNVPTTLAMRLGGEQYQAPTSVTYVTSMAQSPSINLSNSNVYENNPNNMVYNSNNQGGFPVANPGCTSCGCSGQCGTSGAHHGPVHHFPLPSAYPSGQMAYQNIPSFFPTNLPGMPPPNSMMPSPIPGSPRFPGTMLPFQNIPNEMPYGGSGQFGLMPHGQVYLSGMSYGHRGNHSHNGQAVKKLTCYNCGGVGHRFAECREPSMESITQNSLYRLNFKPVPESNSSSDS